jgi:hypothetical protein
MLITRAMGAVAIAALTLGCSQAAERDDALPFADLRPDPATALDTGIGWLVQVYEPDDCIQITDGTLATDCIPIDDLHTGGLRYRGNGTQLIVYVVTDEEIGFGEWKSEQTSLAASLVEVTPDVHLGIFPLNGDDEVIQVRLLDDLAEPVRTEDLGEL